MSVFVDIKKKVGTFQADVQFSGGEEVIAFLGASGCGKSMTLKCIAGIETPDRGKIIVDGVTLFDSEKNINLPPQQRHTGLLFQNYALFPNMTVLKNIRAGARREKDAEKRESLIKNVVENFGLSELTGRFPHQLSGGQQQRVALARILVSAPDILLLDEPFSALDSHLRFQLEREVREIIHRFGKSVILVSHDRDEVFRLADQIAVMREGLIETSGPKKEVFARPKTRYAAVLTGCKNISPIVKLGVRRIRALDWDMELEMAEDVGEASYVGIRMHDIAYGEGENSVLCEVTDEIENPFSYTLMLKRFGSEQGKAFGWDTGKEKWRQVYSNRILVSLPPEKLILLKG